jgi:hypothetical protein
MQQRKLELSLSLMPTTEAIKICNGSSGKHMKTDDSSWKRIGIKWKQNDNIALSLKLIELMIYDYESVKSTGNRGSHHRSILQSEENLQRNTADSKEITT